MSGQRVDPGVGEAQRAREELAETLGQLRDRLDYAQRVDDAVERATDRLEAARRDHPVGFAVGVVTAAVAAGAIAWGVVGLIRRALR